MFLDVLIVCLRVYFVLVNSVICRCVYLKGCLCCLGFIVSITFVVVRVCFVFVLVCATVALGLLFICCLWWVCLWCWFVL